MKILHLVIFCFSLLLLSACEFIDIPTKNSILIVDLNAIAKATGRQEIMQKELEFANVKLSEQLKLVASKLEENITEEKDKIGDSPSDDQKQQLGQLVTQAQQQLLNTKNQAIQQSTNYRSELVNRFRNEVGEIAQQIAARSGGQLVLVSSYETIWFDPSADITDEVIAVIRANDSTTKNSAVETTSDTPK